MKLFEVYSLYDINLTHAKGCYVYDACGQEYLDLYCGHGVISVGHTHPYYVNKLTEQLNRIGFYSNAVINGCQRDFAIKLGEITGYKDYALFLSNSGAEANENAIKLASFSNKRKKVLSFNGAFHGRTAAAVMATDNPTIVAPANQSNHFTKISLNDITSLKRELRTEEYCAVIMEGIQGVNGVRFPSAEFAKEVQDSCAETGTVFIMDEIQSGCGRTGRYFAHQHWNIRPDIITMAKGIGNGFPLAATAISPMFTPVIGQLGTTFGGNHLACVAGSAVIDIMLREHLIDNAKTTGEYLLEELGKLPYISEVRGKGLMIGIDFTLPASKVRNALITKEHVLTGISGQNTLRLLPPLCLSMEDADLFIHKLAHCLSKIH